MLSEERLTVDAELEVVLEGGCLDGPVFPQLLYVFLILLQLCMEESVLLTLNSVGMVLLLLEVVSPFTSLLCFL